MIDAQKLVRARCPEKPGQSTQRRGLALHERLHQFLKRKSKFGRLARIDLGRGASILIGGGVSAILQLNDLGLTGQRRLIARFLTGLMKAPRSLWHPVLVTLDEAHRSSN
jgi:hypothetical protein